MKKVFCIAIYRYLKTFKGLNISDLMFDLFQKKKVKYVADKKHTPSLKFKRRKTKLYQQLM